MEDDTLFTDNEIVSATPTDAERAVNAEREFDKLNGWLKVNHPSIYIKYWGLSKSSKTDCGVTHDA